MVELTPQQLADEARFEAEDAAMKENGGITMVIPDGVKDLYQYDDVARSMYSSLTKTEADYASEIAQADPRLSEAIERRASSEQAMAAQYREIEKTNPGYSEGLKNRLEEYKSVTESGNLEAQQKLSADIKSLENGEKVDNPLAEVLAEISKMKEANPDMADTNTIVQSDATAQARADGKVKIDFHPEINRNIDPNAKISVTAITPEQFKDEISPYLRNGPKDDFIKQSTIDNGNVGEITYQIGDATAISSGTNPETPNRPLDKGTPVSTGRFYNDTITLPTEIKLGEGMAAEPKKLDEYISFSTFSQQDDKGLSRDKVLSETALQVEADPKNVQLPENYQESNSPNSILKVLGVKDGVVYNTYIMPEAQADALANEVKENKVEVPGYSHSLMVGENGPNYVPTQDILDQMKGLNLKGKMSEAEPDTAQKPVDDHRTEEAKQAAAEVQVLPK